MIDELVARIERLRTRSDSPRIVVGVAGAPGSGKSTLTTALVDALGPTAAHVPMDGFHLADVALDSLGRRDRKGAPDTFDAGGYASLLGRARAGETVWAPSFERELEQPIAQSLPVGPAARIVITEGNYLLLPEPDWQPVRAQCDEVWFFAMDGELRRERLVARHVRFGKTEAEARAWVAAVDEPNAALVAASASYADLVVG